jgi:hypothetical protein
MTPFEADFVDQKRIEQTEAARCEWETLGATDAAFGELPQYPNDAYLVGYVRATQELPLNPDGTICRTPKQQSTQPSMFEYGSNGESLRGVNPWHDCNWAYPDE